MAFETDLDFVSTTITDHYGTGVTGKKFAATTNYGACEVTRASVRLEWLEDEQVYAADVDMRGYDITKAGKRDMRKGETLMVGFTDSEDRYNFVRRLIIASAVRHGIDSTKIGSHYVERTWYEFAKARLESFGFKMPEA